MERAAHSSARCVGHAITQYTRCALLVTDRNHDFSRETSGNQSSASQVMHEDMLTMWCSMGIVDGCDVCRSGYMYVLMGMSENVSVW